MFGGPVSVNHVRGGVTIGDKEHWIKLKAWPRIGVLANQLRFEISSCPLFERSTDKNENNFAADYWMHN